MLERVVVALLVVCMDRWQAGAWDPRREGEGVDGMYRCAEELPKGFLPSTGI